MVGRATSRAAPLRSGLATLSHRQANKPAAIANAFRRVHIMTQSRFDTEPPPPPRAHATDTTALSASASWLYRRVADRPFRDRAPRQAAQGARGTRSAHGRLASYPKPSDRRRSPH